jgi:hypothetical protein
VRLRSLPRQIYCQWAAGTCTYRSGLRDHDVRRSEWPKVRAEVDSTTTVVKKREGKREKEEIFLSSILTITLSAMDSSGSASLSLNLSELVLSINEHIDRIVAHASRWGAQGLRHSTTANDPAAVAAAAPAAAAAKSVAPAPELVDLVDTGVDLRGSVQYTQAPPPAPAPPPDCTIADAIVSRAAESSTARVLYRRPGHSNRCGAGTGRDTKARRLKLGSEARLG